MTTYWAHSQNRVGEKHKLKTHLASVAAMAKQFAGGQPWAEEAYLAGLLHDLGKYGDRFQLRLQGEYQGVDHWSAGAWLAARKYMAFAAALAIEGHHIGLQRMSQAGLAALNPEKLKDGHPLGLTLSEDSLATLESRLQADGLASDFSGRSHPVVLRKPEPGNVAAMLDVRMLFSCLTDADFLDTEAHFNGDRDGKRFRAPGRKLDAAACLERVTSHVSALSAASTASEDVRLARQNLFDAAQLSAELPVGLFTATAPTGTGKTLALLAMALKHAVIHDLQRVVIVLPFLNIIEQTVEQYRNLFPESEFGQDYVLEHHSLAYTDAPREAEMRGRALSENWDAPIIVTTTVQFFESLFSNRPSSSRKLHRVKNAVVLFDEAQSLPEDLAVPTLAALSHLKDGYGCSVIFATATQPAFDTLSEHVKKLGSSGWSPAEVVADQKSLFNRVRRVEVEWSIKTPLSPSLLAERMRQDQQALCIVNTRRQAVEIFRWLGQAEGHFYIATNQCAAHRIAVLSEIRERLKAGHPCRVVATQCVEAGVDIDFPLVLRSLAPLDALAQAAGRCNREGRLSKGTMLVFKPENSNGFSYPDASYHRAAGIVERMLTSSPNLDLYDPEVFREYFSRLYRLQGTATANAPLLCAIQRGDFVEVAENYRLIEERDQVNVVVPFDADAHRRLIDQLNELGGANAGWIRRAQRHTVAVSRALADKLAAHLASIPSRAGGDLPDWYLLKTPSVYDAAMGFPLK